MVPDRSIPFHRFHIWFSRSLLNDVELVLFVMRYVGSAHAWSKPFTRYLATACSEAGRPPQTVIEKVVQKYAVGLPPGKVVRAGDYVMIQPEHVMTHDNTGPVISKCVILFLICQALCSLPSDLIP